MSITDLELDQASFMTSVFLDGMNITDVHLVI